MYFRETEPIGGISRKERFVFKNWLTQLWGLASLESAEQTGRLDMGEGEILLLLSEGSLEVKFPLPQGTAVFFP